MQDPLELLGIAQGSSYQGTSLDDEIGRYFSVQARGDIDLVEFWKVSILYLYL
jgi:hypothetical protein